MVGLQALFLPETFQRRAAEARALLHEVRASQTASSMFRQAPPQILLKLDGHTATTCTARCFGFTANSLTYEELSNLSAETPEVHV